MSVSVNLVGMAPGGGGSFPMAGTRPKVRKSLTVNSGSMQWVAPANVYFINAMGCGGGGSGGQQVDSAAFYGAASGGGGGEALVPSTIQVNPGSVYTITIGAGGAGRSTAGNGFSGGNTTFVGDTINLIIAGGGSGSVVNANVAGTASFGTAGAVGPTNSLLGFVKIAGGQGGSASTTAAGTTSVISGSSVEYTLGGSAITNSSALACGGGGASLYGTGSSANSNGTTGTCGPCAGSGGSDTATGQGGSGFFRIIWEE